MKRIKLEFLPNCLEELKFYFHDKNGICFIWKRF